MSFINLPTNLDPNDPQFIPALNDALQRISGAGGATNTAGETGPIDEPTDTTVPVPDAPNVTAATTVVEYFDLNNLPAWRVKGALTIPATDPNIGHTKILHLSLVDQDTAAIIPLKVEIPVPPGASSVDYTSEDYAHDPAAQHRYKLRVGAENDLGAITVPSYDSALFTVPAAGVATLAIAANPISLDGDNRGIVMTLAVTATTTRANLTATFWLSRDNGVTKTWQRWTTLASSPAAVTLPIPSGAVLNEGYYVPITANEQWILYAAPGAYPSTAAVPAFARVSNTLTVTPPPVPTTGGFLISGANFTALPGTPKHLEYFVVGVGQYGVRFGTLSLQAAFALAEVKPSASFASVENTMRASGPRTLTTPSRRSPMCRPPAQSTARPRSPRA